MLYVDDLFLTGADPLIHKCKRYLASEFEMEDLGLMHYFLGLEVWHKPGEIFLSQRKYVMMILERFGMVDCKLVTTLMDLDFKKLSDSAAGPVFTKCHRVSSTRQSINVLSELPSRYMLCSQHVESTHG